MPQINAEKRGQGHGLSEYNRYRQHFFYWCPIQDIVVAILLAKLAITPTNRQKLKTKKTCEIINPLFFGVRCWFLLFITALLMLAFFWYLIIFSKAKGESIFEDSPPLFQAYSFSIHLIVALPLIFPELLSILCNGATTPYHRSWIFGVKIKDFTPETFNDCSFREQH